ncbi:DUF1761 domain-containing protein [Candidatus Pacearchaeota archaeon]|nr:DUF1761 domain-containing protein [Candidatus Pacearchaeota archaeon]
MIDVAVNWWAVIVSALISMVLGMFWYSSLFGNYWSRTTFGKSMAEMKKDMKKNPKPMGRLYLTAFIASLIMAYVLAHFVQYVGATSFSGGMQLGFWVWLGFVAPVQLSIVLWEGKPLKLYLVNTGHYLVYLLITGGLLAAWQ